MQCACTSMVLTRLPLTTTSRRPCACAWLEPLPAPTLASALISQLTKARRGLVCVVSLIDIAVPLVLRTVVTGSECCKTDDQPASVLRCLKRATSSWHRHAVTPQHTHGPAGRAHDQRSGSDGSRVHPRLGHLDFADFHLRDVGAERDPRGLDLPPECLRLRLQVGGVLVGPDPNELVLRPIDPGRHDRPADFVMDRLGLLFEMLDKVIQLALVDGVNTDLCLHLLCLHSRRGICSRSILSGKERHTCLVTAMDLPPPLYPFAAYPSPVHDR